MDLVIVFAVVAVALVLFMRKSHTDHAARSAREAEELAPAQAAVNEDVTALGEQLRSLDSELGGRTLDEGGRAEYRRALDAYDAAQKAVSSLHRPEDVRYVTEIVEDGQHATACVRARVDGKPRPARRPPCFFDPQHGPSVEDVAYAPTGGATRDVPACAPDAERVRSGADPDVRTVMSGSRRIPYWEGGRAYAPYTAGYFSAFGFMPTLFAGTVVGSMLGDGFDGALDGGDVATDGGDDVGDDGWFGGGFDLGDL